MDDTEVSAQIRRILALYGALNKDAARISERADLYDAGMTSHASINVMLALEAELNVEFPDHLLNRRVFRSIATIREALAGVR